MNEKNLTKLVMAAAIIVIGVMISTSFMTMFTNENTPGLHTQNTLTASPAITGGSTGSSSSSAWTYPTTTMQEPGYTNGTYVFGSSNQVDNINLFNAGSLYSFMLLDEIYGTPVNLLPGGSITPWLATSWNVHSNVSNGNANPNMTFDPLTGQYVQYNYTWIVHIRPGVQWTDWTPANAGNTYTYSNFTQFHNAAGAEFNHTYNWSSVKMSTHYVQSADFILSWKMLFDARDFSGEYANVVNMKPINNLTVEYYLSSYSATFASSTLETPILPYHIWAPHDYSTDPGYWNYSAALASSSSTSNSGYNTWGVGYNDQTGYASGLVGTGPFMMNGGYGMPQGTWLTKHYWQLYVNPHFWVQYANTSSGLRQYTPKIYSLKADYFSSVSDAITAELRGSIYTITDGVPSTFVPTVLAMPNTYIYHKPSSGYGYIHLNSGSSHSPLNITDFREALNYATDKAYLASVVSSGYTIIGQPVVPPSDPIWRNSSTPSYAYNPSKARQMISQIPGMVNKSGYWYYNGKQVSVNIQITSAASDPLGVEGALLVKKWWDAVGVSTSVTEEAFSTLLSNLRDQNYGAINLGVSGISGDPTSFFLRSYSNAGIGIGSYQGPFSGLTMNGKYYNSTQVTSLLNNLTLELNGLANESTRLYIAHEIQGIGAKESSLINLGYPIDLLEFTNTKFANISRTDTLPYSSYIYYAFLTTYQRATPLSVSSGVSLNVNLTASTNVVHNGQYDNVTVKVTNSKGSAVSGANVQMGLNPPGALLNVTSDNGTTNSAGLFTWEFKVLRSQSLIYTPGYLGSVNVSAVALPPSSSSSTPGTGSVLVNVLPHSINLSTSQMPLLKKGGSPQKFAITVTNKTGSPVSGFQYTVQSLSGAVLISPGEANQTVSTGTSKYTFVNNTNFQASSKNPADHNDNNVISISGTTGSNGTIVIMMSANSSLNFGLLGKTTRNYLFFGNIMTGSPVTGASGYMDPAEMTTSFSQHGFGTQQPLEFPVEVVQSSPGVSISINTSSTTMNFNGSITVTATVTNTTTNTTVAGYLVDFLSQNVLGANRGYFTGSSSGKDILASNPNSAFASKYMPGFQVKTNSTGQATVTFYPFQYTYSSASSPVFQKQNYTDSSVVPADEFIVAVMGANTSLSQPTNYTVVNSAASIHPTIAANTPAGPSAPLPGYVYIIIGVVVAAIVVGVVSTVVVRRRKNK